MCRWEPSASLLLPGRHDASIVGTVTVQLSFLLSTLLLDMMHDATDRFMGDSIGCCHCEERFFLLHHTLHDCRPRVQREC
jgi:hypothetical protein